MSPATQAGLMKNAQAPPRGSACLASLYLMMFTVRATVFPVLPVLMAVTVIV
jgi:hypothetical protein